MSAKPLLLAEAIVAQGRERKVPVSFSAADHLVLEYGTVNPLDYLAPQFDIPVVRSVVA